MTGPRVLHVIEAVRGGTTRHLVDAVTACPAVEHHVAAPPPGYDAPGSGAQYDRAAMDRIHASGATVHHVAMDRRPGHPTNAAAFARLRRIIRSVEPDAIHAHSAIGGAVGRLAAASTGIPAIYTPNGLPAGRAAVAAERALAPLTARLVAVSESEAHELRRLRIVPPGRLVVIPNGIDLAAPADAADLRSEMGIGPDTTVVGTVARLVAQKAPEQFVSTCAEIARRRPDVHFVLIGMGPLQSQVDEAVATAQLGDRWHQIPYLENAAASLGQLDVFVLLSRFEGGPYTPLEAMRARTPVVLSDVVGNRDAVDGGISGILTRFGDGGGAAEAVIGLLEDPGHRHSVITAATQRLAERFDIKKMGEALTGLYEELAAEGRSTRRRTRRLPHPSAGTSTH